VLTAQEGELAILRLLSRVPFKVIETMAMMRTMFLLAGMFRVTAATTAVSCAVDGAKSVDQLSDAVVFLWAATKRCSSTTGNPRSPQCPMDIASAAQNVAKMVDVIAKAVEDCTGLKSHSLECGMAVNGLVGASAGLTSGSAGIFKDCLKNATLAIGTQPVNLTFNDLTATGKCVVDAKSIVTNLMGAVSDFSTVAKDCQAGTQDCAKNLLSTLGAISKIGAGIAGIVNDCQIMGNALSLGNADARCVQATSTVVGDLSLIGAAGVNIAKQCKASTEVKRLYELEAAETRSPQNSMVFVLAACIPLAAVLSFVGGARFAKRRTERNTQTLWADEADEMLPM